MATSRKVIDGPGKFDLMCSLFDGKRVFFTVEGGEKIEVQTNSVGIEDGSRESWLVSGNIVGSGSWEKFSGYFETRRRQGHIEIGA